MSKLKRKFEPKIDVGSQSWKIRELEKKAFADEYQKGRIERAKKLGFQAGLEGKKPRRDELGVMGALGWIERRGEAARRNLPAWQSSGRSFDELFKESKKKRQATPIDKLFSQNEGRKERRR